jgi:hypothetical protein
MEGWMQQEEYDISDTNAESLFLIALVFWCLSRVEGLLPGLFVRARPLSKRVW